MCDASSFGVVPPSAGARAERIERGIFNQAHQAALVEHGLAEAVTDRDEVGEAPEEPQGKSRVVGQAVRTAVAALEVVGVVGDPGAQTVSNVVDGHLRKTGPGELVGEREHPAAVGLQPVAVDDHGIARGARRRCFRDHDRDRDLRVGIGDDGAAVRGVLDVMGHRVGERRRHDGAARDGAYLVVGGAAGIVGAGPLLALGVLVRRAHPRIQIGRGGHAEHRGVVGRCARLVEQELRSGKVLPQAIAELRQLEHHLRGREHGQPRYVLCGRDLAAAFQHVERIAVQRLGFALPRSSAHSLDRGEGRVRGERAAVHVADPGRHGDRVANAGRQHRARPRQHADALERRQKARPHRVAPAPIGRRGVDIDQEERAVHRKAAGADGAVREEDGRRRAPEAVQRAERLPDHVVLLQRHALEALDRARHATVCAAVEVARERNIAVPGQRAVAGLELDHRRLARHFRRGAGRQRRKRQRQSDDAHHPESTLVAPGRRRYPPAGK